MKRRSFIKTILSGISAAVLPVKVVEAKGLEALEGHNVVAYRRDFPPYYMNATEVRERQKEASAELAEINTRFLDRIVNPPLIHRQTGEQTIYGDLIGTKYNFDDSGKVASIQKERYQLMPDGRYIVKG